MGLGPGASLNCLADPPQMSTSVSRHKRPAAIAMWDLSWLLRHYPTGEFENWDAVLDGLVKRGYNAIRFDVFPALVGPDSEGRVIQEHHFPFGQTKFVYALPAFVNRHVFARSEAEVVCASLEARQ